MSEPDSSRREPSTRRYPILLIGLVVMIGIGIAWRLSDPASKRASPDGSTMPANTRNHFETSTSGRTPSEIPQRGDVPGHLSKQERIIYDRCDNNARLEMDALIVSINPGKVVVRESDWNLKSTSTRVGIASWLSECTQEDRPLTIFGDESANPLATYDQRAGYGSPFD